jgi:hypothetical protein
MTASGVAPRGTPSPESKLPEDPDSPMGGALQETQKQGIQDYYLYVGILEADLFWPLSYKINWLMETNFFGVA